jgi:hypothetical protein
MRIRFRIGPEQRNEQGNGHGGKQSPPQDCLVHPPSSCSPRCLVSSRPPPTENPVDHSLRRGTACCARCSTADQCHSLAHTRSAVPTTKNCREITQLSGISTRFWSKSRSYRKQKTKPCLPGSRIAQCEVLFLLDSCASFAPAKLLLKRPPVAWRTTQS